MTIEDQPPPVPQPDREPVWMLPALGGVAMIIPRSLAIFDAFTRRSPRAVCVDLTNGTLIRYRNTRDRNEAIRIAREQGFTVGVEDEVTVQWRRG